MDFRDALAKLIANPKLFRAAAEAYEKDDAKAFRDVLTELGILNYCWLICRWFCVKVRGGVCVTLCPVQEKPVEPTIEEMLEFGEAALKLMKKEDDFKALFEAYKQNDAKKFQAILNRYEMIRFCVQFCRWFSEYYCTVKCTAFCPPTAKIASPVGNACVQAKVVKGVTGVEIRGIASGGSPFLHYKLEYSDDNGVTWRQDAPGSGDIIIVYPDGHRGGTSSTPVGPPVGLLGVLETTNLEGETYGLKLTVKGGGGITVTDTSQFQLFQKTVVMDEVGRIAVSSGGMPPSRKLILGGKETAVGGYATIGGSAVVKGCGKRYKKYKLLWADGWLAPPGPAETYDSVEAPGSPWQRILEVDYHLMPITPCLGTYNNSPTGDLTRRWSTLPCWATLPPLPVPKLVWNPWTTVGSRKATLLLAVVDDGAPPASYFDSLQIWVDNIAIQCKTDSIGLPGAPVSKCEPLSIEKIMKSGGILEIRGTAWDDEIVPLDLNQPSLNFDHFAVGWKKNCDPSYHTEGILLVPLPIPPATVNPDAGKKRVKNDLLATWDIREKDAMGNPTGKPLPGITPCAYIIQLQVWDNSRINDGTVHYDHRELAFTLEK